MGTIKRSMQWELVSAASCMFEEIKHRQQLQPYATERNLRIMLLIINIVRAVWL